jgi:glucosamine-phosphate N-acetyltransferase
MDYKIDLLDNKYYKEYLELMYKSTLYNYDIKQEIDISNRYIYVILNKENNLIGSGSLFILNKLHCENLGLIEDVFIESTYRNNGLGKILINYLKDKAFKFNCYKIILGCKDHNIKFYEKCGFTIRATEMICWNLKT